MKVGIYDPYLDSLGGGERYLMTLAENLKQKGFQVDVFWQDRSIKNKLEKRFGLNLNQVSFIDNIFYSKGNLLKKFKFTRKYDLIFWLSDGSIPFLFAKKNILHFQVPFTGLKGKNWLNRLKLIKVQAVICNSRFTKKFIDKEYGLKSSVVYPPVAVEDFKPAVKKNLILAVGRFTQTLHAKKQHILIEVFKKMVDRGLPNWQLVLTGGALAADEAYLEKIRKMAGGYPIEILINIPFSQLKKYYGESKIFWHAAGFGENEKTHPERMEHFGMVLVEAMTAGCVPIAIGKGGIPEIIENSKNGYLWENKADLEKLTLKLIKSPGDWKKLSSQAVNSCRKFSREVFNQRIDEIINF